MVATSSRLNGGKNFNEIWYGTTMWHSVTLLFSAGETDNANAMKNIPKILLE